MQSHSITTNQAAIIALFGVMNRYGGNLPPMPGLFPDYPAPVIRDAGSGREIAMMRWGMPPRAAHWRAACHEYPQRRLPTLAGLAQARKPVLGPGHQLRRIRAAAEPGDRQEGRSLIRAQRGPAAFRLRGHLDRVQGGPRARSVEAGTGASSRLRLLDDGAERRCRADPSKGDAGDPHHRRGARRMTSPCLTNRIDWLPSRSSWLFAAIVY